MGPGKRAAGAEESKTGEDPPEQALVSSGRSEAKDTTQWESYGIEGADMEHPVGLSAR